MVLADKIACPDGWGQQANRLTLSHTAFGVAVISAARRAPRPKQTLIAIDEETLAVETTIDHDSKHDSATRRTDLPNPPPHAPSDLTERQNARARAANRRIAEREQDLNPLHEELVRRENEIVSLQASLDLTMNENARLTMRLADSETALARLASLLEQSSASAAANGTEQDPVATGTSPTSVENREAVCETRSQLEKVTAELAAAKTECSKLIAACNETNKLRELETNAFMSQIDAMFSRAVDAEKLLAATRQKLLERTEQNDAIMRVNAELSLRVAESDTACERAHSQVEQAKTASIAAVAKCNRLAAALEDGNEKRLTDFRILTDEFEIMSSRAIAAETALIETRRSLFDKFELLQKRLETEARQNQKMKQSRAKLIEGTCALLKMVDIRGSRAGEGGEPAKRSEVPCPGTAVNVATQIQVISDTELLTRTIIF